MIVQLILLVMISNVYLTRLPSFVANGLKSEPKLQCAAINFRSMPGFSHGTNRKRLFPSKCRPWKSDSEIVTSPCSFLGRPSAFGYSTTQDLWRSFAVIGRIRINGIGSATTTRFSWDVEYENVHGRETRPQAQPQWSSSLIYWLWWDGALDGSGVEQTNKIANAESNGRKKPRLTLLQSRISHTYQNQHRCRLISGKLSQQLFQGVCKIFTRRRICFEKWHCGLRIAHHSTGARLSLDTFKAGRGSSDLIIAFHSRTQCHSRPRAYCRSTIRDKRKTTMTILLMA